MSVLVAQRVRTLRMHGRLGALFGEEHRVAYDSPAEAVRWAVSQLRGDKRAGAPSFESVFKDGLYVVMKGDREIEGVEELSVRMGKADVLTIIPVVGGDKRAGIGKAIVGALILAAAVFSGFGAPAAAAEGAAATGIGGGAIVAGGGFALGTVGTSAALLGASTLLSGVVQMLSPVPHVASNQNREPPNQRANFLLSSIVNQTEEGGPLSYIAGLKVRCGTTVGSAGLRVAYTPLSELLDEETDYDSFHDTYMPLTSFSTDTIDFVGFTRLFVRSEDVSERGPYGVMNPVALRGMGIYMIGETRDRVTNDRKFHVIIGTGAQKDIFQLVRVTTQDESTEYIAKASSTADAFNPYELRRAYARRQTADGLQWVVVQYRAPHWTWNLGTGGSTVIPPNTAGQTYRVKFSY